MCEAVVGASMSEYLVGGRGEDLGRDGRGHLVQVAGDAVLLQRAEGLGARGVVLDGGLVTAAPG